MPTNEQEIIEYVQRLSVEARERGMKPSALHRLPLEERHRILQACAEDAAGEYDAREWEQWQGGDIHGNGESPPWAGT